MELDVEDGSSGDRRWDSRRGSTNSTFSITPNTNRETANDTQTPATLVSDLGTVSSNQVEQHPQSTSRTNPPVQPPSPSPQSEHLHTHDRQIAAPPPEVGPRLYTLIQRRATLLASGNTSDKGVYNELLHLEEQIQILRRQDVSLPRQDTPPAYEIQR